MIIELFTDELVYGHAILWPSIVFFIAGILMGFLSDYVYLRIIGFIVAVPAILGIIACISSGAKLLEPEENPVTKIEIYPVELRPENNTLYVFINGNYTKVSMFTNEYIAPTDTMFKYYYENVGGQMMWGEKYYTTFERNQNVTFLDSMRLPVEIEFKSDTIKLDMTPSGEFIVKPDSLQ